MDATYCLSLCHYKLLSKQHLSTWRFFWHVWNVGTFTVMLFNKHYSATYGKEQKITITNCSSCSLATFHTLFILQIPTCETSSTERIGITSSSSLHHMTIRYKHYRTASDVIFSFRVVENAWIDFDWNSWLWLTTATDEDASSSSVSTTTSRFPGLVCECTRNRSRRGALSTAHFSHSAFTLAAWRFFTPDIWHATA